MPFFNLPRNIEIDKRETLYLEKIIDLCQNKKVTLILINVPKRKELLEHEMYGVYEFEKYYDENLTGNNFSRFFWIKDLRNSFNDLVHLNIKGSTTFSIILKNEGLKNLKSKYSHYFENPVD